MNTIPCTPLFKRYLFLRQVATKNERCAQAEFFADRKAMNAQPECDRSLSALPGW